MSSLSLELVSMLSISSSGSMFCSSSKLEKSGLNRKDILRNGENFMKAYSLKNRD